MGQSPRGVAGGAAATRPTLCVMCPVEALRRVHARSVAALARIPLAECIWDSSRTAIALVILTGSASFILSRKLCARRGQQLAARSWLRERPGRSLRGLGAHTMDAASEPPLADAVARPATTPASLPAVLEDRLGAEVREGVRTLQVMAPRPCEAAALDELSRLNQLARQRQAERESLFASLADDVPSLEAALLETRRELAEAQLQRSGEAALAQQLQQRLAVRDAQAHEQAAELRRLQARSCTLCASPPPLHRLCTSTPPLHRLCTAASAPPSPSPPPAALLQAELQAEQARRQAAEGSSASQQAVSSGMGLKARKLEEQLAQAPSP